MTEQLKQDIQEQLEFLPKESQEAINSFDWAKISEEIGKKYFLIGNDIEQTVLEALSGYDQYLDDAIATALEDNSDEDEIDEDDIDYYENED